MKNNPYTVIAYRWGWKNSHHYFVGCVNGLDHAESVAIFEHSNRGGKYGCVVYNRNGEIEFYKSSSYCESKPFWNYRIELNQYIGFKVTDLIENNELTIDKLKEEYNLLKETYKKLENYYE